MILKEDEGLSPRLKVCFRDREYSGPTGPKSFQISSSLTNIYDGFTLEFDNYDGRNNDMLTLALERWTPVVIQHSDPLVDNGAPIPAMFGVITGVDYNTSVGPSNITLTGFDLGKLFDSCVPTWKRLKGLTWQQLAEFVIDSSWRSGPTTGTGLKWGIQRVVGIDLNSEIKLGRAQRIINYGTKYQQFVPPIQTEPGQTSYDLLSQMARLQAVVQGGTGSLVNVSALGDLQIFNPDDKMNAPAIYSFEYHLDDRNQRIKEAQLRLDGSDLYTDYEIYSSVITRPGDPNKRDNYDPNAAKIKKGASDPALLGVRRRLTFADQEQYTEEMAAARLNWRIKMAFWNSWTLTYTVQGHSMPGAGQYAGRWLPLVEGNICEVNDSRNKVQGKYIIESVTRIQQPQPVGTISRVVIRKLGVLGG